MDTHHCPRCELRFVTTSELRQHFSIDHGGDSATFERYRYRAGPTDAPSVRTLLLVGNQTLEDEQVLDEVVARADRQARVIVLVPTTPLAHQDRDRTADEAEVDTADDDAGAAIARWRLNIALGHLRRAGLTVEGRIGAADPFVAVTQVLATDHVDDIVVSTLPASSSRWLGVDLPGRLRRFTHRPVEVLTPAAVGPS